MPCLASERTSVRLDQPSRLAASLNVSACSGMALLPTKCPNQRRHGRQQRRSWPRATRRRSRLPISISQPAAAKNYRPCCACVRLGALPCLPGQGRLRAPSGRFNPSQFYKYEAADPRGLRPRGQWCGTLQLLIRKNLPAGPGLGTGRLFRSNLKHHNGMTVIKHPPNCQRSPSEYLLRGSLTNLALARFR